MTPEAGLFGSSVAFVGTHFLLSHPLRRPLVQRLGENVFRALYSLIAFATFGLMIYFYRITGDALPLWTAGDAIWTLATVLMWIGSILFVGSFGGNPALPGGPAPGSPKGVFAITRHPMMWGFALWSIVHLISIGTPKALVFYGAFLLLALGGSVGQDAKKRKLMGEAWHEWTAQTAFVPFSRGVGYPGTVALLGGTLLFLLGTWLHGALGGAPAGLWRWIG